MDGHLPKEVVQERFERLIQLQDDISLERNVRHVGTSQEVIVEGASKRDASRLTGRTRHNKLVHFPTDGAGDGSFRTVRITGAHHHYLEGELVDGRHVPPRAPRRVNLPLVSATASRDRAGC
jgi:tRNA-2-methylthio-N6-dimethylallyladenosine synthase